ncbi:hypothetical protein [Raoultella ornithinolytica]|nr:hypothetical protein [Raoultella ornithinolytica]
MSFYLFLVGLLTDNSGQPVQQEVIEKEDTSVIFAHKKTRSLAG